MALGAIAGALGRYYAGRWLTAAHGAGGFPVGTFAVNISGCLIMGLVIALCDRFNVPPDVKLLLTTGALGAYTTFSTYSLETLALLEQGRIRMAGLYWIGSAVLGLVALGLGSVLGGLGHRS